MTTPRSVAPSPDDAARAGELAWSAEDGALAPLLAALTDPSWTRRRQAVAALAALGQPAIAPLCALLAEERDVEARVAAVVDALVASQGDPAPALVALAEHGEPAVVADVAQVLGRRRTREAVPLLARLVAHRDDNVVVAAIEALGRVGGPAGVEALLEAIATDNFFRVFPAIDVLGRADDPRALAPLVGLLASPTYRLEAARALGRTGEVAGVGALVALMSAPGEASARVAAVALFDLLRRHRERFGQVTVVEEALVRSAPAPAVVRRLARSLVTADRGEQQAIAHLLGILGGDDALVALRGMLTSDEVVNEVAAQALRRLGEAAHRDVREALAAGGSEPRAALLRVVSRPDASIEVIGCLADPDPNVRALACEALARIGVQAAVPELFRLLEDRNLRVVQAAIGAIQCLGSAATPGLALHALEHRDASVRHAAMRILAYLGAPGTLQIFRAAIAGDDRRLAEIALGGVALLDEAGAVDTLAAAPQHADPRLRGAAMRALGHSVADDDAVRPALLAGLGDPDAWVRYYACQALGRRRITDARDVIERLLDDAAGQVRVAAIEALIALGDDHAIEALVRASAGPDADVRRAALLGLGAFRRADVLPVLLTGARDPDPATRVVALSALAERGGPGVLVSLTAAAGDPDVNVRSAAIGFLVEQPGRATADALIGLLAVSSGADRLRVLDGLARPAPERVAALAAALESCPDEMVPELIGALARIRTPAAISTLIGAASLPRPAIRRAAVSGLAAIGTIDAVRELQRRATDDPDLSIREVCAVLLAD